jgi:metal-responsive CopG/Arc/MetJ family transcriptional regulator
VVPAQLARVIPWCYLARMKVAISLPDPVFNAAELLAQELCVSRSQLYAQALSAYLESRSAAAVTAKLNEIYGSESAGVEPALMAAQFQALSDEAW